MKKLITQHVCLNEYTIPVDISYEGRKVKCWLCEEVTVQYSRVGVPGFVELFITDEELARLQAKVSLDTPDATIIATKVPPSETSQPQPPELGPTP